VLLAAMLLGETLSLAVLGGVLLIIAGVFFVTTTDAQGEDSGAARTLTLTSIMATLCYGIVPVLKKFGTDLGGPPVLGALVMHATGLALLLTLGRLLKIELKWHKLPLSSFLCFVCAGVLQGIGSILTLKALLYAPASVVAPIWNTQPIISFILTKVLLQGIEVVTLRDGVAAALVVMGVLVLRWG
jgi:drug/metabolite transporter (DMT)-like permease